MQGHRMGFLNTFIQRFWQRRNARDMILGKPRPVFGGFRWSLYITRNDKELFYAMHEHSVIRIVGYVMGYFKNGQRPVPPWNLYLNFNKRHQHILLDPTHFTADGENVTKKLIEEIESIDPGYRIEGAEPVFLDARSKKRIKISQFPEFPSIESLQKQANEPKELTFYSIMDEVFGKTK